MLVGVEHDDGDGQDVDGVRAAEDARALRVELPRPGLQDADDLLRLPRQLEGLQELPDRILEAHACAQ